MNVLEIGAGGGRSTAVMLDQLGARVGEYHVVDVSAGFIEVLKDRIDRPLDVHIVDDVDLSMLPADHFDVCLAQSSWSHINLYDQFRYLRALRRVMKPSGVVYVSGQFLLGVGNDWTWDRFVRRVYQIDHATEGVVHEFTSVAMLAEMLTRLGYEICCVNTAGFVARRGPGSPADGGKRMQGAINFPFNASPYDFLATGRAELVTLPTVVGRSAVAPTGDVLQRWVPPALQKSLSPGSPVREGLKRIPGVRPAVISIRRLRHRTGATT